MTALRGSSNRVTNNRRRSRAGRWALVVVTASTVGLVASPSWASSRVEAHVVNAPCSLTQIKLIVSTDQPQYGPGAIVKMTASMRNTSPRSCTIAMGPSSPTFTVLNSHGVVVWSRCGVNSGLAACPQFLALRTLAPGVVVRVGATWDQRSGTPLRRVAPGTYRARARFARGTLSASTPFGIVTSSAPRTILASQTESGDHFVLRRGDHLIVRLASSSLYTWSAPTSSNDAVLRRSTATSGASASATFIAFATGQVEVRAVDNPTCYPQCLPPSRLFVITVRVTA